MRKRLTLSPRSPGALRIVQVTDTHIAWTPGPTDLEGVDTFATLRAVLAHIGRLPVPPEAILLTGDLVDQPSMEAYGRVREAFADSPCPVVCLPGNHDDPVMMRTELNQGALSTHSIIDAGNWRILLLDDYVTASDGGRLTDHELEFLAHELKKPGAGHVLVCLHHQPVPTGSPWMDDMALDDPAVFLALLDDSPQVRAVIWGHVHQEFSARRGRYSLWSTPSTCVQFRPGVHQYAIDPLPPGYRILDLHQDGRIDTEVVRVG